MTELIMPPKDFLFKNIITEDEIYKNYEIEIDKCLVDEIKKLWELGIHTTGCCCGHKNHVPAYIGIEKTDIPKMIELGYEMFTNEFGNIEFIPKSQCNCDEKDINKIFNIGGEVI